MIRLADQIPLQLQLFDGSTTRFPRAVVKDATGVAIAGSPFNLSHVANGQYSNLTAVMPATPFVTVQYIVFTDGTYTVEDSNYADVLEVVVLDTSLPTASYTAPNNADIAAIKAKTDNLPADPASEATVNTRLAAASYTAPDNAGIATLLGRLTLVRANLLDNLALVDAAISSRASDANLAIVNSNVLLTELESAAVARYNQIIANIAAIPVVTPPTVGAIADAVWDEATAGHVAAGSFGLAVQSPALDPQDVANAVWDAALVNHADAGTFGENAQNPALNPTDIADAVWDAPIVNHLDSGSTGLALSKVSGGQTDTIVGVVEESTELSVGVIEEELIVGTVHDDDII